MVLKSRRIIGPRYLRVGEASRALVQTGDLRASGSLGITGSGTLDQTSLVGHGTLGISGQGTLGPTSMLATGTMGITGSGTLQ